MHCNHLTQQTSPYLLQHAENPVEWYPWGEEALTKARNENKPILLSIGYSACHWCHVMAHESFEDQETADLMNQMFINIKVDREERPDLDKIYQLAHQLLTQRAGGWPLTMFLTPDEHVPFFGGTYFPKEPRYNMPAFKQILDMVSRYYHEKKDGVQQQNAALEKTFTQLTQQATSSQPLNEKSVTLALIELEESFDPHEGGFGQAPKFPHSSNLELLLYHHLSSLTPREKALPMLRFTLNKMALGGIYDQLGGGFCRYSVDDFWHIPHFEKMLYDNGPLISLYAHAWQLEQSPFHANVVKQTARWVIEEMQSPEGGYYSSLDADSEGHEGKFYVWDKEEVQHLLSEQEYAILTPHYGLNRPANFEGKWHLIVAKPLEEIATNQNLSIAEVNTLLESAHCKLMSLREQRIRPGRDEKVLSSWNALMIKGMAIAGRVFQQPAWIQSAQSAMSFVRQKLWYNGQLLATYKDGKAHLNAYLDDYAFMLDAGISLLQAQWDDELLTWLDELASVMLEQFEDAEYGGFFFTAKNHEKLMHRPKPFMDESTPSGNGIAAISLLQLGQLLGKPTYLQAATRTIDNAAASIERIPHAHASLLLAFEQTNNPPKTVVITGPDSIDWQKRVQQQLDPSVLCFALDKPSPLLHQSITTSVLTSAQLCSGDTCYPPIDSLDELLQRVNNRET